MDDLRYAHILSFVLEHPWAITRPMLQTIAGVLAQRAAGQEPTAEQLEAARLTKRDALPQPPGGAVAVIPVYGVLLPRANLFSAMSGAASYEELTAQLREALALEAVSTIVLDVDSPGGNAAGATEFAREVMRARTKKPIIAQAQYTMASAAYWIASAATEIVASPSASIGSIGVFSIHEDLSKALEQLGITRTYISAGKYKTAGNETEPLGEEAAAFLQRRVNETYDQFLTDVSRGRGVPIGDVRTGYGEGRTVGATEALELKMVDKIATLDETVERVKKAPPAIGARAAISNATAVDTAQELPRATAQDRRTEAVLEAAVLFREIAPQTWSAV